MKCIQTRLTEKQFLDRFELYCFKKKFLGRGFFENNEFVYKMKDKKFWLGRYPDFLNRNLFVTDRLDCKYKTEESGYVTVEYKYGKQPIDLIWHSIAFALGLPIVTIIVVDAILNGDPQIEGLIISLIFLVLGVKGLFFRSKRELLAQEECLKNICNIK